MEGDRLIGGRGGTDVTRSGERVRRSTGPWTPTVHAFLRHLDAAGFAGAPRVLDFDAEAGMETLLFIEGIALADPAWLPGKPTPWPAWAQTDAVLEGTAALLRELHDASASFAVVDPVWRNPDAPSLAEGRIVCHCDIGPHNTIYRDGLPVAFIDWDEMQPRDPDVEFGIAAWYYVPLADQRYFAKSGFGEVPDLAGRLLRFASAYGLTDAVRVRSALRRALPRVGVEQTAWLDAHEEQLLARFE